MGWPNTSIRLMFASNSLPPGGLMMTAGAHSRNQDECQRKEGRPFFIRREGFSVQKNARIVRLWTPWAGQSDAVFGTAGERETVSGHGQLLRVTFWPSLVSFTCQPRASSSSRRVSLAFQSFAARAAARRTRIS